MFQHIFCDEVLSIIIIFFEILKVKHLIGFCSIAAAAADAIRAAIVVAVVMICAF